MKIYNIGKTSSLFNKFMSEIRDNNIQKDSMRFRRNLERIGEIMAYEISKTIDSQPKVVETSLGSANIEIPRTTPILATILRAGLPFYQGFLNYYDDAHTSFICAHRKHTNNEFEIIFDYIASPDITGKTVIIADTMLASGVSMEVGYKALLENGKPDHVHIASVLGSQYGVEYIIENIKDKNVSLWLGSIDPKLNEKSYIVPGLGDAGDLAYGSKLEN